MIVALKFLHIAALVSWCAALIALPLVLHAHGGPHRQRQFTEFRLLSHVGYTAFATPAAVIAISAGTALIFVAEVYEPWLLAKLAAVAGMVTVHAWLGHLIQKSGEEGSDQRLPSPLTGLVLIVPLMAVVLWLVLAKPDLRPLQSLIPEALLQPQERGF